MVNISITFAGVTNLIDYRRVMKAGFPHFFVSRVLHIILFARLSVCMSDSTPSLSPCLSALSVAIVQSLYVCLSVCLAVWLAGWLAGWLADSTLSPSTSLFSLSLCRDLSVSVCLSV